jgi:glyoxylase-like metal-dependent hydrolase (beta-lactamase superfamily II)
MLHIKVFTFNPIQENTYLIYNDTLNALIVDPGFYFSSEQAVFGDFIKNQQLNPALLINTHCHLDHVFGNKWVYDTWGLEMWLHPDEEKMLELAPLSGEKWGLPFDNYHGPLHFLNQGDTVKLGDDELKVILAPGHSPGSICFYCEKQKILIAGDVLFRESIGRSDLFGGNHETLLKSIREQLFVLPDDVVVYPGHGIPTTIGYEKRNNPFLQ